MKKFNTLAAEFRAMRHVYQVRQKASRHHVPQGYGRQGDGVRLGPDHVPGTLKGRGRPTTKTCWRSNTPWTSFGVAFEQLLADYIP